MKNQLNSFFKSKNVILKNGMFLLAWEVNSHVIKQIIFRSKNTFIKVEKVVLLETCLTRDYPIDCLGFSIHMLDENKKNRR